MYVYLFLALGNEYDFACSGEGKVRLVGGRVQLFLQDRMDLPIKLSDGIHQLLDLGANLLELIGMQRISISKLRKEKKTKQKREERKHTTLAMGPFLFLEGIDMAQFSRRTSSHPNVSRLNVLMVATENTLNTFSPPSSPVSTEPSTCPAKSEGYM